MNQFEQISPALKSSILSGPKAVETSYTGCKHKVTSGGNIADPSAELHKFLSHIEYETQVGRCGLCHLFDKDDLNVTTYGSMPPNSSSGAMNG